MTDARITDYDRLADRFDQRYATHAYEGVGETLLNFLSPKADAVLEVGCGTGHWLAVANEARLTPSPDSDDRSAKASAERFILAGVDPSARMLAQALARSAKASAFAERPRLVQARAEDLPWQDASFDRLFCVNALHHFSDRSQFFAEARRVLRPGGGLLTINMDPHTDRDEWWVYDYFEPTRAIDRERFARVRTLRGELALAGFSWTESMEADHFEAVRPAAELLAGGVVDKSFTSQLAVLSDEELASGAARLREANEAAGGELQLVTDIRLYATIGWLS